MYCIKCARRAAGGIAALVILSSGSAVSAAVLDTGFYALANHPGGSAQPPLYGLRLDGLLTGDADDTFTFDFDDPESDMFMELIENAPGQYTINITGQTFGGLDIGAGYDPAESGLWEIDFTYNLNVQDAPGDDDIIVIPDDPTTNSGTITKLYNSGGGASGSVFLLEDKAAGGYSFRLGDEDNDGGHRGYNGISGWGWLKHGVQPPLENLSYSDWLFTATKTDIPTPGTLSLLAGAFVVATRRRRR